MIVTGPDTGQPGVHSDLWSIPITEAKARSSEYESERERLDILGDDGTLADLRRSRVDFAAGDAFAAGQVRAELEQRRGGSP
jgi:hypothetical protein